MEASRWQVDIRSKTLAALPLSTAGGAVRKAAEGALDMRSILSEGDLIAVSGAADWWGRWLGGCAVGWSNTHSLCACCPPAAAVHGQVLSSPPPQLCASLLTLARTWSSHISTQAEVQAVRADGQIQLHVRDAVASKLPPGMLVAIPPTLVRPQRKHVYHWPAAGAWWLVGAGQWALGAERCVHMRKHWVCMVASPMYATSSECSCTALLQASRLCMAAMEQCGSVQMAPATSRQAKCMRRCRWQMRCERRRQQALFWCL